MKQYYVCYDLDGEGITENFINADFLNATNIAW